jgi:GNAT superfamily N-acetyltransferase
MIASGRFEMAVIRRAGKPDEMVILNLWTRLIEYHRSIEAFRPERWKIPPEDAIRPLLTTAWELPESHAAFVAQSAGKVFGFVYMGLTEQDHCPAKINALFVDADERSRGAGQALLDAALDWCRARGAAEVSLDCIWPNNLARRFYENRRFRPLLVTYVLQPEPDEARIRPATAADVSALARVVQDAYRHYIPRIGKPPGPMLDDYSARVSEGVVSVIEDGKTIVGVLVLLPKPDHLLLDNIAVSPAHQGQGFGRRLLEFAEEEARRQGYQEIRLYTHETMTENQRLYAAIGYEETGRGYETGYERVFMRKRTRHLTG